MYILQKKHPGNVVLLVVLPQLNIVDPFVSPFLLSGVPSKPGGLTLHRPELVACDRLIRYLLQTYWKLVVRPCRISLTRGIKNENEDKILRANVVDAVYTACIV